MSTATLDQMVRMTADEEKIFGVFLQSVQHYREERYLVSEAIDAAAEFIKGIFGNEEAEMCSRFAKSFEGMIA